MCSDVKILVDVCACLLLDYKSLIWCPIHHGVARRGTNPKTQELSLIELAKLVKSARHLGLVLLPRFSSNSRLMRVVCDRKRPFTLTECESRLGWELWEYMGLFYDRNPTGFLLENESIKGKREINDLSFPFRKAVFEYKSTRIYILKQPYILLQFIPYPTFTFWQCKSRITLAKNASWD